MNAMAGPNEERMDALTEALARLLRRQQGIEHRLDVIEHRLGIAGVTQAPARFQAPPPLPAQSAAPPTAIAPPPASEPSADSNLAAPLESRMGMVWVNRIGVITLVLGVAFFFKYAVDNRWIGETGRVVLGILAGLLTLGCADWAWRRDQKTFAQGIAGAGIAILYVSFYAAFGFYRLVPQPLAFTLMVLNTVAAAMLGLRYGSPAIAALGLAGGYLTPVVLSTGEDRPWVFLSYVLLISAGGMAIARLRNWRALEALAFPAATVLYCSWLAEFHINDKPAAIIFALAFYALFLSGRLPLAPLCQVATLIELLIICMPHANQFFPLAAAISITGLGFAALRNRREMPLVSLLAFWAPYLFFRLTLKEHNGAEGILAYLTLAFFVFSTWTPWRVRTGRSGGNLDFVLVALNAGAYFSAGYDLLQPAYHPYLGLFAAALALFHLGIARAIRSRALEAAFYSGVALCFTTLAIPIQFAGCRITMAWALEGAALAWIAARMNGRRLVWASLAVFGLTLIRLLTLDSWMYSDATFGNSRFLTFLTCAVALWLTTYWTRTGLQPPITYVAGHFVLLWGLALEVLEWAGRSAPAPSIASLQSASISILLAGYAVILVAIGFAKRSVLNRILGLLLIAAVVAKLYLYDVWQMTRGMYRVAAFAGLGMFLLITSYLYSRYRGTIETLWRGGRSPEESR